MARSKHDVFVKITGKDALTGVLTRAGGAFKALGALAGVAGGVMIGQKFVQAVSSAIKVTSDFQTRLSEVAAVTRATAGDMNRLSDQAKELGRTTVFTAVQAAEAQATLARAGFQTKEVLDALSGTMDLASAGSLGLADASGITANIVRSFGLEASEATDVADLLAKSANTSNQTVSDLGEAFAYAAPAAKVLGADMTETAAAMNLLADRGIKASVAGTGLRRVFATFMGDLEEGQEGLGKVSDQLFDADGKFVGLAEAIRRMKAAGIDASDSFSIFGQRAGNVMAILLDLPEEALEEVAKSLEDRVGFAADVAKVKLNNLGGDVTLLKSAMDGFRIAVGEGVTPALRVVVRTATAIVEAFTGAEGSTASLANTMVMFANGVQTVMVWIAEAIAGVRIAWNALSLAWNLSAEFMTRGLVLLLEGFQKFAEAVNVGGALDGLIDGLDAARQATDDLAAGFAMNAEADKREIVAQQDAVEQLRVAIAKIPDELTELNNLEARLAEEASKAADSLNEQAEAQLRAAVAISEEATPAILSEVAAYEDLIEQEQRKKEIAAENLELAQGIRDVVVELGEVEVPDIPFLNPSEEDIERGREITKQIYERNHAMEQQQKILRVQKNVANIATRALLDNAAAAILGAKSASEAIGAIAAAALDALANEAIVEAAKQVALGLAALASFGGSGNPAMHFASAAKWGAVGLLAKVAAGSIQRRQAGGIITGIGGVDSQVLAATPGESVISAASTREILGGRAAVVPLGGSPDDLEQPAIDTASLRGMVLDGDRVAVWMERNAAALGRGFRRAVSRGEL